ncbi:hypothetical protein Acsp02_59600 [Actinoplanes sp. NBRC 103695]|nr:hypothetical protein Acsp02_59600 [Actinoplanes sp. NBRC 103695]
MVTMKRLSTAPAHAAPARLIPSRKLPPWARKRRVAGAALLVLVLVLAALWPLSRYVGADTVRVVAVGDMACDPADPGMKPTGRNARDHCRHRAVSDLAVALDPAVLVGLGDFQYELPTLAAYHSVYGPSFGRLRDRTVPVYGNQEYKVQDAATFTEYFGDRVRDQRGYWSEQVGRWHLVVLNSNCGAVAGGCGDGSPQQTWLDKDLAAAGSRCVLAAWHHPRWSTGIAGPDPRTDALYRTLAEHKVEIVLSGHEAHYERFPPLNPAGERAPEGVRQFVAGTGGQAHYRPSQAGPGVHSPGPASEYADYDHHGVLELTLTPTAYEWRFHALEAAEPVSDSGRETCY